MGVRRQLVVGMGIDPMVGFARRRDRINVDHHVGQIAELMQEGMADGESHVMPFFYRELSFDRDVQLCIQSMT